MALTGTVEIDAERRAEWEREHVPALDFCERGPDEPACPQYCRQCGDHSWPNWPCDVSLLLSALSSAQARADRLAGALGIWAKFAYYATGKSGHKPIELPLWCAVLFSEAARATAALGKTGEGVLP